MTNTVALLPSEQRVEELTVDSLAHMGYEIARVRLSSGARDKTLQIMIDRVDGKNVNIDDCEKASIQISATLDVHDPISGAYHLEVSSPGVDRPLTRPKHFAANVGHEAKIETRSPVGGRRRFKGTLLEATEEGVTLRCAAAGGTEDVAIPFAAVGNAHLVLTDALLAAAAQGQTKEEERNEQ
ncbi:MAG: ribosome maturation factor RimP [Rickettsiales bacterium]